MAEPVIFEGMADFESIVAGFDEILAAAEAASEAVAQFGTAAGDLSGFDEILSAIQSQTDAVTAGFEQLDASLTGIADLADTSAAALQSLDTTLSEMAAAGAEAAAGADEAAAGLDRIAPAAEEAGGALDGLRGMQGPLLMIGTMAAVAGAKVLDMGLQGQKGEALLSGMAGASQQDIAALQQEALKLGVTMDQASAGFYEVESAGYSGSKAITVFDAAMKLTEGGQAQAQDVMTGLTAIMHDYNLGANQASHTTDLMATAVLHGKQSMQDFATSIGPLASAGHTAGVSLDEVLAAESTMTQINPHVRQDTMQLAALFQSLSPTMGKTAETAKKLGLSFDETHYASLDLIGRLEYLAQIAGGDNTAAFVKLTGGVRGSTAAIDLLTSNGQAYIDNMQAMGHATGATEQAFADWENTIPGHLDHVGAAISVFTTQMMDNLGPRLNPILDNLTSAIPEIGTLVEQTVSRFIDFAGWLGQIYTQLADNGTLRDFGNVMSYVGSDASDLAGVVGTLIGGLVSLIGWLNQGGPAADVVKVALAGIVAVMMSDTIWSWGEQFVGMLEKVGGYLYETFVPVVTGSLTEIDTAAAATSTDMAAIGTAAQRAETETTAATTGMKGSLGTLEGSFSTLLGLAGALTIAIENIPSPAPALPTGDKSLGGNFQLTQFGNMVKFVQQGDQTIQQDTLLTQQIASRNFDTMYKNASDSAVRLTTGVTVDFNQLSADSTETMGNMGQYVQQKMADMGSSSANYVRNMHDQIVNDWFDMHKQVYSETQAMSSQALTDFQQLNGDLTDQMASTDANVIGYWNDIANYIANNPINGYVNINTGGGNYSGSSATTHHYALGTDFAPGGFGVVGELGPEVMYIPRGAQILPTDVLQSIQSLSGGLFGGANNSQVLALLTQLVSLQQRANKPTGPQLPPTVNMWNQNALYGITNIQDVMNSLNSLNGYVFEQGGRGAL